MLWPSHARFAILTGPGYRLPVKISNGDDTGK
jgi:hypothetical protein